MLIIGQHTVSKLSGPVHVIIGTINNTRVLFLGDQHRSSTGLCNSDGVYVGSSEFINYISSATGTDRAQIFYEDSLDTSFSNTNDSEPTPLRDFRKLSTTNYSNIDWISSVELKN